MIVLRRTLPAVGSKASAAKYCVVTFAVRLLAHESVALAGFLKLAKADRELVRSSWALDPLGVVIAEIDELHGRTAEVDL